ncbi:MAG TPA: HAD-IIA family hydrolase [Exilispira sp.]|nr:HAD-IIA family hydrolase [Exilispira sp.]
MKKNNHFELILFDIDGVLEYQGKVYPGAIELTENIREHGINLRFLTNSTLKSAKSAAFKLQSKGFNAYEQEVITASKATALYLKELNPRSIWLLLSREGVDEFSEFIHDSENPEYVVIGDCRDDFNFSNMNKVLQKVVEGAKLIGMISGLVDSSLGSLELNVGSWVGMIERAANVKATYIGKPNRFVFDLILSQFPAINRKNVLMVGDSVDSDIIGARNAGIRSVLVKQGEFSEKDLLKKVKPDYIIDQIGDLSNILFLRS